MLDSFFSLIGDNSDAGSFKLAAYIVGAVVILVIISLLLDYIKKYIRGLDIAGLGVLLAWLGYKTANIASVVLVSNLFLLVGITLAVVGLIVFIFKTIFRIRRSRKAMEEARAGHGAPMPTDIEPDTE